MDEELYGHTERTEDRCFLHRPFKIHVVEDKDMLVTPGLYGCNMNAKLHRNEGTKSVLAFDPDWFA